MSAKAISGSAMAKLRISYEQGALVDPPLDPFVLFDQWMNNTIDIKEPNAFTLSTCADNRPSSRVVLLKDYDRTGFTFYTNYGSKKAQELTNNPYCAMNFYWGEQQVRVEGIAKRVSEEVSSKYFLSRPKSSQIGAWVSKQSTVIENYEVLEKKQKELDEKYEHEPLTKPDFWGGFLIVPTAIEFWQGRPSRLHDRYLYTSSGVDWTVKRLSP